MRQTEEDWFRCFDAENRDALHGLGWSLGGDATAIGLAVIDSLFERDRSRARALLRKLSRNLLRQAMALEDVPATPSAPSAARRLTTAPGLQGGEGGKVLPFVRPAALVKGAP